MREAKLIDVTDVEVVRDRVVRLRFSDGLQREVDLARFLWGPAFRDIADNDTEFAKVYVDREIGTIRWPNGADLDPYVLHGDHEPMRTTAT